eukprot:scaffold213_cov245-Pinguiococcus_pyrenoidosus.AAC.12
MWLLVDRPEAAAESPPGLPRSARKRTGRADWPLAAVAAVVALAELAELASRRRTVSRRLTRADASKEGSGRGAIATGTEGAFLEELKEQRLPTGLPLSFAELRAITRAWRGQVGGPQTPTQRLAEALDRPGTGQLRPRIVNREASALQLKRRRPSIALRAQDEVRRSRVAQQAEGVGAVRAVATFGAQKRPWVRIVDGSAVPTLHGHLPAVAANRLIRPYRALAPRADHTRRGR